MTQQKNTNNNSNNNAGIDLIPAPLRDRFQEVARVLGITDEVLIDRCLARGFAEECRDQNAFFCLDAQKKAPTDYQPGDEG